MQVGCLPCGTFQCARSATEKRTCEYDPFYPLKGLFSSLRCVFFQSVFTCQDSSASWPHKFQAGTWRDRCCQTDQPQCPSLARTEPCPVQCSAYLVSYLDLPRVCFLPFGCFTNFSRLPSKTPFHFKSAVSKFLQRLPN